MVENIRKISKQFGLIFFLEILFLGYILCWGYFAIDNPSDKIKNTGSVLASLIIVLLTTALVYYNFYQMPELKFMGFSVMPLKKNELGEEVHSVEDDFLEHGTFEIRKDVYSIKFPLYIKKVECKEKTLLLSVRNKITNLGLTRANVNEIRYYMTFPKQERPLVIEKNILLDHQEIEQIIFEIPSENSIWDYALKGGTIVLKFEAIGATGKYSKRVWIRISDELKIIEWSESKLMLLLTGIKSTIESLKNRLKITAL